MDVILLERVGKLGHIGDTVRVKDGYARNFLLPRGKALRATEANKQKFEVRRADLEARNNELKRSANEAAAKLDGVTIVIIRQAGETGQLHQVAAKPVVAGPTQEPSQAARGPVGAQQRGAEEAIVVLPEGEAAHRQAAVAAPPLRLRPDSQRRQDFDARPVATVGP